MCFSEKEGRSNSYDGKFKNVYRMDVFSFTFSFSNEIIEVFSNPSD